MRILVSQIARQVVFDTDLGLTLPIATLASLSVKEGCWKDWINKWGTDEERTQDGL